VNRYPARVQSIVQKNAGASAARNAGLARATGEYIAYLDSDDYLTPDAIEVRLKALEERPGVGIVMTDKYNLRRGKVSYKPRYTRDLATDDLYGRVLTGEVSSAINTALIRMDVARRHLFPVHIRTGHDTAYLTKMLFHTRGYVLAKPTLVMRYHDDSLRNTAVSDSHPRLALIQHIFDDPEYGGALAPYRAAFATEIYLFMFKRFYKSGNHERARHYYLQMLAQNPLRNLFRLKPLLRFLRSSLILQLQKLSGRVRPPA
jgi:glycosyltransferase involved in cell wall biosynthesis